MEDPHPPDDGVGDVGFGVVGHAVKRRKSHTKALSLDKRDTQAGEPLLAAMLHDEKVQVRVRSLSTSSHQSPVPRNRQWYQTSLVKVAAGLSLFGILSIVWIVLIIHWRGGSISDADRFKIEPPPVVSLRQGTYVGVHEDNNPGAPHLIEAFLGVPFAQTTGGKNRFQPAVPLQPLDDIKVVDNIGPGCIGASDGGFISEDCLNLNIWRSAGIPANTTVPVVVYIHGGAFTGGSNRERDMASFVAWSKQPILAVSINYRIGALGFLPSQFMEDHGTINLGLRDQLFALQWVHDNIEAFGGNKDEVTIMGASAGAHSIGHHLMYQIDQPPLFKRVVMESGAPTARACYPVNGTQHERQLQEFFALTGLNGTMSDEARWEALMHMDGLAIGRASKILMSRSEPSLRWPFQPAIDGVIIPKAPIDSWKAGEIHKVPILTGFNSDEGTGFIGTAVKESHEFRDFFETLIPKLSSADLKELEELYPDPATHADSPYVDTRVGVGAQFKRLAAAFGHFAYICPVRHTAHFGPGITDVYLYQFAVNKTVNYGAAHGYNFEYVVFSGSVQGAGKEQKAISSAMHEYWANFVAHGKPGSLAGDDESLWEPYAAGEGQKKMVFGEGSDVRAGGRNLGVVRDFKQDDWPAACEWWWSKAHLTES